MSAGNKSLPRQSGGGFHVERVLYLPANNIL
jgi:hypothetical protein